MFPVLCSMNHVICYLPVWYTILEDLQNGALNTMKPTWPFREKHFFPTIAYHGIHTRPRIGGFSYKKIRRKNCTIRAPYGPRNGVFVFKESVSIRPPQRGFSYKKIRQKNQHNSGFILPPKGGFPTSEYFRIRKKGAGFVPAPSIVRALRGNSLIEVWFLFLRLAALDPW